MKHLPIAILGGGPTGFATALLLARRQVRSTVFDARPLEAAQRDARLLALSRGSVQMLAPLARLPAAASAPINTVYVSSQGEFGRVALRAEELGGAPLGLTIAYGDLLGALAAAVAAQPDWITVHRPARVDAVLQRPDSVRVQSAAGEVDARLALSAEGYGGSAAAAAEPQQMALVGDVEVEGLAAGDAIERFTRAGPLALLPLARAARPGARWMSLVWCMSPADARAHAALPEPAVRAALQAQLGPRIARVLALELRGAFPLHQAARDQLAEHRLIYLGNSAQTLHPVAGQGFNLALRDARELAERIGAANAHGEDPLRVIPDYLRARRADRALLLALTRGMPRVFAERFAPLALARSLGLTALATRPALRAMLARTLMFGLRV